MGLDMYLRAQKYYPRYDWEKTRELREQGVDTVDPDNWAQNHDYTSIVNIADIVNLIDDNNSGLSIEFNVGYWRKANAIHNWFVNKLANGVDECQEIYVSRHDLEKLSDSCAYVLRNKDKAMTVLPPVSGFFFGSTELDEWYFHELKRTIEIIDNCLSVPDITGFTYQSSW